MKIKKSNTAEKAIYIVMCIGSFGMIWVLRALLTIAIRKAFEEK